MKKEIINSIVEQHGTPFYAFESKRFEDNYNELFGAFSSVYSNFTIAYSFKTNYMPAACKKINELGGWAEVVSDMEYNMAKEYGFIPSNIIVNGPGKWNGLEDMVTDGAIIMLDNEYEYFEVIKLSQKNNTVANVGFRLNIDIGTNKLSRFGFDVENPDTKQLISKAIRNSNLNVIGIHFHLGGARGLTAWEERAKKMIFYKDYFFEDYDLKIIDLGSGMFGHINPFLGEQFHQDIPSFDEYANAVASQFKEHFDTIEIEKRPMLIVEPGTTLIANSMSYVTTVIGVKEIRGKSFAMVDGSVHQLGELGKKKELPIDIIYNSNSENRKKHVDITGYTCLEDDVLRRNANIEIGIGDTIVFENAGAYTNVMKPPFIQVGCGIFEIYNSNKFKTVKRKETVKDILSTYVV